MSDGYVKLSSKATWSKDQYPDCFDPARAVAPEQFPILELWIELTEYRSRKKVADMLRVLANAVDEGSLHPFDCPGRDRAITGTWNNKNKQWIISELENQEQ